MITSDTAQMLARYNTSYHRGFVADLFYQVPARPPVTDLPVFLREAGPLATQGGND